MAHVAKLVTVASNGQISIGKEWAGRQIVVEKISHTELRILSGSFIPDKDSTFHTAKAEQSLSEFNDWMKKSPPVKTNRKSLMERLEKKAREKRKK